MKKHFVIGVTAFLCLCLLVGCGAPATEKAEPENKEDSEPQVQEAEPVQEMTTAELEGYFEKAYEAKGSSVLETPEQLESELAELKTLTADVTLPEDHEAQYQEWRSGHIEIYLAELQEGYCQIIDELPLYDGISGGAVYADLVDLEGLGKPNLLVVNVFTEEDFAVYGDIDGHIQQYSVDIGNTETIQGDSSYVSLVTCDGKNYIKTQDINGHDLTNIFYKVQNGQVQVEAAFYDGSELAPGSEEKELLYSDIWSRLVRASSRGILPELFPDIQQKTALLEVLDHGAVQYACLADMNGDAEKELITVEDISKVDEYSGIGYGVPIFRAYVWNGSELEAVNIDQPDDASEIGGVYQEKNTGKVYVNFVGGAGPYSWDYFERVSEMIKVSDEELSWEEYEAQKNRFELVEDLLWQLPKPETVEAVRQLLMER